CVLVSFSRFVVRLAKFWSSVSFSLETAELSVQSRAFRLRHQFTTTFCSYPKGGTFTTKLDLKN
ncbi:MAG: hypothetical protein K9J84_11765, partial [Bacteroidia bacterium]|nr:hypothetical protein [Bacteroidia bacterium]